MRNIKSVLGFLAIAAVIALLPFAVPHSFASGIIQSAYQVIQDEGSNLSRFNVLNFTGAGVTCSNGTGKTVCDIPNGPGTPQLHNITFVLDGGGSVIATGAINKFPPSDYACTINRIDVTGNPSGSFQADIWKAAGAIPTSGNKISASAPATLSSSPINLNGSLTGWTTGVSVGDVFGATVVSATTVTSVTVVIWCQ
jgi:hypothetical protein